MAQFLARLLPLTPARKLLQTLLFFNFFLMLKTVECAKYCNFVLLSYSYYRTLADQKLSFDCPLSSSFHCRFFRENGEPS
jgi:hypothetical protein